MFDMDRWLKRLWMVNGVLLLGLLILGTGALLVSWLSGAFSAKNAVIAPDTTRSGPVKPRAVRFSAPREIWGTKTRLVVVGYGKSQQGAGLREYYSSDGSSDQSGPRVNVIFLTGTEPGRVLLDKPAYIGWLDYPSTKSDSLQRWIRYHIAFDDTNKDGRLDSDDRADLYVSDVDGSNLRRVLPPGMRLLDDDPLGDGRHLIVTALQVPNDWRGPEDELRERAFLYDVQTGATTPYVGLDSLVQRAARVLGRP